MNEKILIYALPLIFLSTFKTFTYRIQFSRICISSLFNHFKQYTGWIYGCIKDSPVVDSFFFLSLFAILSSCMKLVVVNLSYTKSLFSEMMDFQRNNFHVLHNECRMFDNGKNQIANISFLRQMANKLIS